MIVKCNRCGEVYDFEYDFIYENGIQKVSTNEEGRIIRVPYIEESITLCPSCMAKLNDWLKGEQERQAKWIYDHESNSIECDKCRAEYKLSPYERVSDFDYCPNCGAKMEGIKE